MRSLFRHTDEEVVEADCREPLLSTTCDTALVQCFP